MLSSTLDRDTFVIVDKKIELDALPKNCVRLFGSSEPDMKLSRTDLAPPSTRSLAIVDRYADMRQAAMSILRARFSFAGQAPLAPDVILVNEFRIKEFCTAIAEFTSKYFATQLDSNDQMAPRGADKSRATRITSHELDRAGAEVVISGSKGVVARISDRNSPLLRKRIEEPLLLIHPVRSIDDAIDFANKDSEEPLSAVFAFGTPEVAKYVSQFIRSHLTCVNHIPVELLVAPITPVGYETKLNGPYSKEMFSIPKPELIQFEEKSSSLCQILDENDTLGASKLRRTAETMNTKVQQPAGSAFGFFEQGLILGATLVLTTAIVGNILFWKYGVPIVLRKMGR